MCLSAEYISKNAAITAAAYAVDEHPYDKNPEKPETFSEYNQGWNDACDYIRERLEDVPVGNVATYQPGFWESYDTSAFIGIDDFGEPRYARRRFYRCHRCRTGSAVKSNYCSYCGSKMVAYE